VTNKKIIHCAYQNHIPLYYWLKGNIGYVQKGWKSWEFLSLDTHDNDGLVPLSPNNTLKLFSKKNIEVDGYNDAEDRAVIHPARTISRKDLYAKKAQYDELRAAFVKLCEINHQESPAIDKTEVGPGDRKTWLKYMLCAAAIIARTDRGRLIKTQQTKKDKIFNYVQLESLFKDMAGQLFGTDSSSSNPGYGLSDITLSKILTEALEKYPIDVKDLLRK
jgi:hypothetical protein